MDFVCLDTETFAIERRPNYPPRAVGVSVKWPGKESQYYAFGHASGNNCSYEAVRSALLEVHMSQLPLVFHNAKFDLEVIRKTFDFSYWRPDRLDNWRRIHDTAFLAFLLDPHARRHDLKSLAEKHLDWPADEQDYLSSYAWQHKETLERLAGREMKRRQGRVAGAAQASNAAEFYAAMPGSVVAPYAMGDTDRTAALFSTWMPEAARLGMGPAYARERRLLPIFMANEETGMRCDVARLEADTAAYSGHLERVETAMAARLGVAAGFNFDADQEYAKALIAAGIVREEDFPRTAKTGALSVAKDALKPDMFSDPYFAQAIGYRNRLKTCLTMFMEPWLKQALARPDRHVSTNWNQTRGDGGGTRTGRPSTSDPNFLNISKSFEGRSDDYTHPAFLGVPELPLVRQYMLPDEGDMWLHRDFSGQEVRMFAHFESGELAQAYRETPDIDVHTWIRDAIAAQTGVVLERTRVKNVTFARLYGGGLGAIERQARCSSRAEAQQIANYHDLALPGRKILDEEIRRAVGRGQPIRTWGGRLYHPEPSVDGRDFGYKLINYLVQGSSADLTKDRLIAWDDWNNAASIPPARFLVTVYDEINISAPVGCADAHMASLRDIMQADLLDVPMLTDGKQGPSWGELSKCG